jgi:hypothetical protein
MKSKKEMEQLARTMRIRPDSSIDDRILEPAVAMLENSTRTENALTKQNIWRIIMKNPITKIAAAAAIIIVVLVGLYLFPDSATSLAWGEVTTNVEQSPGFICRSRVILTNSTEARTTEFDTMMYGSITYGIRVDQYENEEVVISSCGNRAENMIISIIHPTKTYSRKPLLEQDLSDLEQMSPKKLVKQYLSTDYKELGRDIIDGVEVRGIEVNDPGVVRADFPIDNLVARLFVSVESGFPVMLEAEIVGSNGALKMQAKMDNFQWNVEHEQSVFEPDIPAGYTLQE